MLSKEMRSPWKEVIMPRLSTTTRNPWLWQPWQRKKDIFSDRICFGAITVLYFEIIIELLNWGILNKISNCGYPQPYCCTIYREWRGKGAEGGEGVWEWQLHRIIQQQTSSENLCEKINCLANFSLAGKFHDKTWPKGRKAHWKEVSCLYLQTRRLDEREKQKVGFSIIWW